MCDKDLLVDYLYDEIEPGRRRAIDAHLAACSECRAELAGLRATRVQLTAWAPPQPDLAFQVVRAPAVPAVARPLRWSAARGFGLAAAAVLVLAAASAIANLEVKYGADGLAVRTGWGRALPSAPAQPPIVPAASTEAEDLKAQLQLISRRLHALEAAASAAPAGPVRTVSTQSVGPDLLRQVQRIVAESEDRQQQQLAMRVGQVNRDVDVKLRGYAEYFQRGLQQVQGLTDTTILRQREMENHLSRVVLQQPK